MRRFAILTLGTALIGASLAAGSPAEAATPRLTANDQYVVEGITGLKEFTVGITLSSKASVTVQVSWALTSGTASAGEDFVAASGQVSLPAGQVRKDVALQLTGDDVPEGDETFRMVLSNPAGARIFDGSANVLVVDDDQEQIEESVTVIPGKVLDCPRGDTCTQVVVRCAGTPPTRGWIAAGASTTGSTRGVIVLFSGARGNNFWGEGDETVVNDLQAEGFEVDRVNWPDGWGELEQGPTGPDVAACRPAAVTQFVHDTRYVPLGLSWADGVCGFCVGGNSGGASQAAYSLAEYGLDAIIDAAVLTSGPSLAALAEGCLGDPVYEFSAASSRQVDLSYGTAKDQAGPCYNRDAGFEATWREDSLIDSADDLVHPTTRMEFIQGGKDFTTSPAGADLYVQDLLDAGSPWVIKTIYPLAGHGLKPMLGDPAARAGIIAAFAYMP